MTDLFSELKHQTSAAHQTLEATAPFNTMLKSDSFSSQSYKNNLTILASFHQYVAQLIEHNPRVCELSALLQPQTTLQAIHTDLRSLTDLQPIPQYNAGLENQNMGDLIAAGYVWMGSSMGAKMLHRWLLQHNYSHLPIHYYAHMASIGRNWRAFQQLALQLAETHQISHQRCAHSAKTLFEELIHCANRVNQVVE